MGSGHHYAFCHHSLPGVFFRDPGEFFAILQGPDAQRFLHDVWAWVGERADPETRREPEGLRAEVFRDDAAVFAIVYLPPPAEPAEGHMAVAIAGFADPERPSVGALSWSRFFTLELGQDFVSGEACTFLGEWTREGQHRNFGKGPAPTAEAFVTAVLELGEDDPVATFEPGEG